MARYELAIQIAAPDYFNTVRIESEYLHELMPTIVEYGDLIYERYPGEIEGTFVDVRCSYIVTKRQVMVEGDPEDEEPPKGEEEAPFRV